MREILFRGKAENIGMWVYGWLLKDRSGHIMIQDAESFEWYTDVDPATVGQYTGLQDKNGKKIFEADIIKCDCWCVGKEHGNFSNFEVKFLDDGFCAGRNPLGSWLFNSINGNTKLRDVEVIGNIHDNLELLEVK